MPVQKKFMFVNRKAPHGTIYALESLEVVLITAAFDRLRDPPPTEPDISLRRL